MKKRIFAGLMAAVLLVTSVPFVMAAETQLSPNIILLEGILSGNRGWVYETLVADDRSSNPMAILNGTNKISMAEKALNVYYGIDADNQTEAALYRGLVDTMMFGKGEWYNNLVDGAGELVSWVVGFFTGKDDLEKRVDDLTASADELGYERLLKSAFTKSYSSSTGETIDNSESSLMWMRQTKDTLDYLNTFVSFVNSGVGGAVDEDRLPEFSTTYLDEYALPYADSVENLLSAANDLLQDPEADPDRTEAEKQASARFTAAMAAIAYYSALKLPPNFDGYSYKDFLAENLIYYDVATLYGIAGKVLSLSSTAMDEYLTINTLQQQKETVSGPITRMSTLTSDPDMENALTYFAKLMSDEYDTAILSPDSIINYLRTNEVVTTKVSKAAKDLVKNWLGLSKDTLAGATLAKGVNILSVSTWVADKVVGLDATCKKTYELLRLQDLTDLAADQCAADAAVYQSSKTDENAKKVLDDLQLLQRLRLYGENVAYGLAAAQTGSALGVLFSDGEDLGTYWDEEYQRNVDTLMAASVMPPLSGITIPSGETGVIYYHEDGGFYYLRRGELEYVDLPTRLAGGISLNGTLIAMGSDQSLSAGFITVDTSSGALLAANNGTFHIGELAAEEGTFTLQANNNSQFSFDTLDIQNCQYISGSGQHLKTEDLILSGALTGGSVEATGDVTGNILSGYSASISDALILCGTGTQRLNGTLKASELRMTGAGPISANGTTYVTNRIYGPDIEVRSDKNIIFSGDTVETGYYNAGLTVQNATLEDVSFAGALMDRGGTTYLGTVNISGVSLFAPSTLEGGTMYLSDTLWFAANTTLEGADGTIHLSGDATAENSAAMNHTLILEGTSAQEVTGELTVSQLNLENTGTISVSDHITVTDSFSAGEARLTPDSLIQLEEGCAYTLGSTFGGSLAAYTLDLEQPLTLGGDLILRENAVVTMPEAFIGKTLRTEPGATLSLCQAQANTLEMDGNLTLIDGASISIRGQASMSGILSSKTDLSVSGDLLTSSLTTDNTILVCGDLQNTGASRFAGLTLNGTAAQTVSGDGFTVETLHLQNTSKSGVTIKPSITVTDGYTSNGCPVTAGKILGDLGEDTTVTAQRVYEGDLELTTGLTLSGCAMTVSGDLTLNGDLILENGQLLVEGRLFLNGNTITIDENSTLSVGSAILNTCPVTLEGTLNCAGDLSLTASDVSGRGHLVLGGDLWSSGSLNTGSLTCSGLTRQHLNAGSVQTGDLTLTNPSAGGVVFQSSVIYTGVYTPGSTAIFGETYLTKEAG